MKIKGIVKKVKKNMGEKINIEWILKVEEEIM